MGHRFDCVACRWLCLVGDRRSTDLHRRPWHRSAGSMLAGAESRSTNTATSRSAAGSGSGTRHASGPGSHLVLRATSPVPAPTTLCAPRFRAVDSVASPLRRLCRLRPGGEGLLPSMRRDAGAAWVLLSRLRDAARIETLGGRRAALQRLPQTTVSVLPGAGGACLWRGLDASSSPPQARRPSPPGASAGQILGPGPAVHARSGRCLVPRASAPAAARKARLQPGAGDPPCGKPSAPRRMASKDRP
jgi:hypothetical protein